MAHHPWSEAEIDLLRKEVETARQKKVQSAEIANRQIRDLKNLSELQDAALDDLVVRMRVVEGAFLRVSLVSFLHIVSLLTALRHQHEPSRTALLIQLELDDIRYCVVSVFMAAFPATFTKRDMMVAYY